MEWKHINSFSAQKPYDFISAGSRRGSYSSYNEYLEDVRTERYNNSLASSYLDTTIIVGRKFVASEFATSEFPSVLLHKPAPVMKHALEMKPPPLLATIG